LYRLERIFTRHGLELKRSTTCGWMAACADLLRPLVSPLGRDNQKGPPRAWTNWP
jgi:hypothetical protein